MNAMKDRAASREDDPEAVTAMVRYAAVISALGALGASPARAAEAGCPAAPAEIDAAARAEWPDLPARIQSALAGRDDIDRCARITIRFEQDAFVVEVTLPDGRSAARSLARKEDLLPTLEALLLVPASEPAPPAPEIELPRPDRNPTTTVVTAAPAPPAPGWLRLEFSVAAGARIGDGQTGVALGALTLFDLHGWLLGFEGATQQYNGTDGGPGAATLELAMLSGRRFRFGDTALDVTAGPALATRGFGSRVSVSAQSGSAPPPPPPAEGDSPMKRLLCGARWTFRARSVLRVFAGVEGEIALDASPAGAPAAERLPSWTAGLVVGTTVGTL
jgi:hypothetical protein